MRTWKYRLITGFERPTNKLNRWALRRGWALSAFALLETTGRRSRLPRHTPIGNGLDGGTFWLVAAHGLQSDYVRNIEADPHVRVKIGKHWHAGIATLLPDDDPVVRSRRLPYQWDAAFGRIMGSAPLSIRIDLDPAPGSADDGHPDG
jgi:deazaflavin-dependent oxidoreductase (nitroreductase family)